MQVALTGFTLVELIVWLIVGAIVGAIGAAVVGYSPGGLIGSIAVGLVGALLGTWLAHQLGLPALLTLSFGGTSMALLWAIRTGRANSKQTRWRLSIPLFRV